MLKVGVLLMATKETLIAIAIKDSTAVFTSDDVLMVAGITSADVNKIRNTADINFDKYINDFLKSKYGKESKC